MSRNVNQVYQANPAIDLQPTDLFYFARWPYLPGSDDFAVQWATILSAIGDGFVWTTITSASANMNTNTGYIVNRPSLVMLTMPNTSNVGDVIEIDLISAGGFQVAQPDGMNIQYGNKITSTGAAGSISSQNVGDVLKMRCVITNTLWQVVGNMGNLIIV